MSIQNNPQKKQKPNKPAPCFPKLPIKSQAADQIQLSVYQSGPAVIQEERELYLVSGRNRVQLEGLPVAYAPNSLTIIGAAGQGKFSPGSASYRPANLDLAHMLQNAIGQDVKFARPGINGYTTGKIQAILGNQVLIQQQNGLVIINYTDLVLGNEVPASLSATPAICFNPAVDATGDYTVQLMYEANRLSWSSRYCLFFDEKSSTAERLDCLINLTNQTGADFRNAKVKLLAGNNAARGGRPQAAPQRMVAAACSFEMADAGSPPSSEVVGDVRMYQLPQTITLQAEETQQTALFNAEKLSVKKNYFLPYDDYYAQEKDLPKQPIMIKLSIENAAENGLGYAIPAGPVDIYQKDSSGSYQKIGCASTDHVSDKETMKLTYGPAADLKATRRLVHYEDIIEEAPQEPLSTSLSRTRTNVQQPPAYRLEQRELTIFNYRANEDVEVDVSEAVPQNAELQNAEGLQRLSPSVVGGKVTVKAGASVKLTYSIKYRTR